MKKLLKVCTDLLFITVVMYVFTHIVKHFYDFDVGTAVVRPFREPSAAAIAEYVSVPEEETTCVVKVELLPPPCSI